jgi:hypothetical protein
VGLLAPVRYYIEPLLHPSAQHDALTTARRRAFIAPRLLGSVVASGASAPSDRAWRPERDRANRLCLARRPEIRLPLNCERARPGKQQPHQTVSAVPRHSRAPEPINFATRLNSAARDDFRVKKSA